jgi:hypothetical protein
MVPMNQPANALAMLGMLLNSDWKLEEQTDFIQQ